MEKINLWEQFYEYDAERPYEERSLAHTRLDIVLSKIIKYARTQRARPLRYMDIGFTDSYLLRKTEESGLCECYGIEIAHRAIERIRPVFKQLGLNTIFRQGSITAIPFEDNFFHMVTACEVIEHMSDENLNIALSEIRRVLVKNGEFIATTPFRENILSNQIKCPNCGLVFDACGHHQSFDEEKWENLLLRHSFVGIEIKRIYATDFRLNRFRAGMPIIRLAARLFQVNSLTKLLIVARKP